MASFELSREIAAPAATVFETISDHRRYPEFTPIRRAVIERAGREAPNGVGAIRALHVLGPPIREEVIEYRPPTLFRYRVLSGVPVRSQIGTVRLVSLADGTRMDYEIVIEPLLPLTGAPTALAIRAAIGRLMSGVAAEAERRG